MRTAQRLAVTSARARFGRGMLASLALHGGAAGLALAGLFGAGPPTGSGEPQAIAVVFVPGPPGAQPGGTPESASVPREATEASVEEPLRPAEPPAEAVDLTVADVTDTATSDAPAATAETMPADPAPPPGPIADAAHEPRLPQPAPDPPVDTITEAPTPETAEADPLPLPPPPPPRAANLASPPPKPSAAAPATPTRTAPPRAVAWAATDPGGGGQPVGRPDAAGPPAPAAEAAPILTHNPGFRRPPAPPVYPRQAIARGIEGTAVLRVLIGPDGETIEVRLHRSSGAALLDRAAKDAVERWAFRPAVIGGRPMPAWVEVPVRFRLD